MTDINYLESQMNCDSVGGLGSVPYSTDSYHFNVGDVILDIEKNSHISEMNDNTSIVDNVSAIDNRQFNNSEQNFQNESNSVGNLRADGAASAVSGGVTVNFNAYNEIHSPDTDVGSVMTTFSEKLAEAVALAAEGIHF